tara:strand:- start:287 stop:424 length:138 start_codon:yes stop_codon:yes gene_type:complete
MKENHERMINGILFMVAGIAPILVYIALAETGILDKVHKKNRSLY